MKPSICIVGAGPSGLVAAKTFVTSGRFQVTVYEQSSHIGGAWAQDKNGIAYVQNEAQANVSRFALSLSELDWHSVDLSRERDDGAGKETEALPMFVKAWQVTRYLEAYRSKFIPQNIIQLGCRVTGIRMVGGQECKRWELTINQHNGDVCTEVFDHVVLAQGSGSEPRYPAFHYKFQANDDTSRTICTIHSSEYSNLTDLFSGEASAAGGRTILVVGGGNPGIEVAATIATEKSNAKWSLGNDSFESCRIVHVLPRALWILPKYIMATRSSASPAYVPVDFELSKMAQDKVIENGVMESWIGGYQSDLHSEALDMSRLGEETADLCLADQYTEYVRSGDIAIVKGMVNDVIGTGNGGVTATITGEAGQTSSIEHIGAIVYATGNEMLRANDILDEESVRAMPSDLKLTRLPLLVSEHMTTEAETRIQSRTIERLGVATWSSKEMHMKAMVRALSLGMDAEDSTRDELTAKQDESHDDATSRELQQVRMKCFEGRYVARAIFSGLQGNWTIRRTITSDSVYLSGRLTGTAAFHPRYPTRTAKANPAVDRETELEYLYIEQGEFVCRAHENMRMTASRRYVYRYADGSDTLSVWFVRAEDVRGLETDYLFHKLRFAHLKPARSQTYEAGGEHLCVQDMYTTRYRFQMCGFRLVKFDIEHSVKGPGKDYVATTRYSRPARDEA